MLSLRARVASSIISAFRPWRRYRSEESVRTFLRGLRTRAVAAPTASTHRGVTIESHRVDGQEIVHMRGTAPLRGRILYAHGGGYAEPAVKEHWGFIAHMAATLGLEVVAPRYPLAPEATVETTMPFMHRIYRRLIASGELPLIVMGDSAGGGLALALSQHAFESGDAAPAGLVLISPWLDCSMAEPDQAAIEPLDPFLRRAGLLAMARWYAGTLPLTHPWVSPLNGSLAGLPPMLVVGGSRDLLVTDSRRLAEKARQESAAVNYYEYSGMVHCWPLAAFPFPERENARRRIEAYLRDRLSLPGRPAATAA